MTTEKRIEQEQIVSAAIQWKRETDREAVEKWQDGNAKLISLSEGEIHLYRVVSSYMAQRGLSSERKGSM